MLNVNAGVAYVVVRAESSAALQLLSVNNKSSHSVIASTQFQIFERWQAVALVA